MRQHVLGLCLVMLASSPSRSDEELKVGGLYCVLGERASVTLVKVLAVDPGIVHLRPYTNRFSACPSAVDPNSLTWFIGHLPIDTKGFLSSDGPRFLMQTEVSEEELSGYLQWQRATGFGPKR